MTLFALEKFRLVTFALNKCPILREDGREAICIIQNALSVSIYVAICTAIFTIIILTTITTTVTVVQYLIQPGLKQTHISIHGCIEYLWRHQLRHEENVVQKGSVVASGFAVVYPRHHPAINSPVL